MVRGDGELAAFAAADFVSVATAFGARKVYGTGRREFVEGDAMAVRNDIGTLSLGNLVEIHSNAGKADGLGWGGARIRGGQLLDVKEIDAPNDGGGDEE